MRDATLGVGLKLPFVSEQNTNKNLCCNVGLIHPERGSIYPERGLIHLMHKFMLFDLKIISKFYVYYASRSDLWRPNDTAPN